MRKALAMGAMRGVLVTDPALAGADLPTTIRVLAAAAAPGVRPAARGPGHLGRRGWRRGRRGRRATRPAAAVRRRGDRARPGRRARPGPPAVREGLRRGRGADARGRLLHPGARRAALPVAQGDHGRALAGDRPADARRPRARIVPADGGAGRRASSPRRRRPPAPPDAWSSAPPADAAREIADFLADRRLI